MGGPLKLKFANHFIIYQKCPFKGQLCLAGYAQSSVPGELNDFINLVHVMILKLGW